ncbi:hypothetical protein AWC23_16475 [Mycobacterium saskatchewanense]|uniref:Uncharacterized protein n=1 Tax=Mycobacterium saskatchewanense TaxID=220927 RepID=A0AAJ3NPM1_9MYCO|nr:hypothetical protein AWC23_16475 [Mycobacterium saskatchewanense]
MPGGGAGAGDRELGRWRVTAPAGPRVAVSPTGHRFAAVGGEPAPVELVEQLEQLDVTARSAV